MSDCFGEVEYINLVPAGSLKKEAVKIDSRFFMPCKQCDID
jgi:hypothetical protein